MRRFYVDFENVKSEGLKGVGSLTANDVVYILFSCNADTVKMHTVKQILRSKATIEAIEADVGVKNALDFQLLACLSCDYSTKDTFYIVSNDTGYDKFIKTFIARSGTENIFRMSSISKIYSPQFAVIEAAKYDELGEAVTKILTSEYSDVSYAEYIDAIVDGIKESENISSFYNACRKAIRNSVELKKIYWCLRDKFTELKQLCAGKIEEVKNEESIEV